jgi:hypothetical protein
VIPRHELQSLHQSLGTFPAVAILGPRQAGKTTLALELSKSATKPATYLDLERDSDRAKLDHAELFLGGQRGRLLILDEVQRRPELFPLLRSEIDARRRAGEDAGQFLVLGSASRDLLRQSSESLAGRIAYHELAPLSLLELGSTSEVRERLWLRGGFPTSFLAASDELSFRWRGEFVSTYLERDLPQLGARLPAELVRRFWTMLSFSQGDLLNAARLAASLGVSGQTVRRYLDVLTDLYLVRQLPPWSGNERKRLVKAPKVYVRDSGLVHRLTNLADRDTLLGHPLCGASWEGFAIEQLLVHLPETWRASFYRTGAGAEIDLVLEGPRERRIAIEVKRTSTPTLSRGFCSGVEHIGAQERYFVIPEGEPYPIGADTTALGLSELCRRLIESA